MPRRRAPRRSTCTAMSPRSATSCGRAASSKMVVAVAKQQDSLAGDVDALVMALDARAALDGITQSLGKRALDRSGARRARGALARLHAARARHVGIAHRALHSRRRRLPSHLELAAQPAAVRHLQRDGRTQALRRRVLVVAPISIRELFDDDKALTNALRAGSADETSAAITEHANRIRAALATFLADTAKAANPTANQQVA